MSCEWKIEILTLPLLSILLLSFLSVICSLFTFSHSFSFWVYLNNNFFSLKSDWLRWLVISSSFLFYFIIYIYISYICTPNYNSTIYICFLYNNQVKNIKKKKFITNLPFLFGLLLQNLPLFLLHSSISSFFIIIIIIIIIVS